MSTSYEGPERRKSQRRIAMHERREMVRYEINKPPRRSGKERRMLHGWDALPKTNIL